MSIGHKLLLIAGAGACGTLARYGLSTLAGRYLGTGYPWGTTLVNLIGCFLFALVWSLVEAKQVIGPDARLVVLTGFMGAFTTFSTFIFESGALISGSQWGPALANILGQNILGLIALAAGLALGKSL